MNMEEKYRQEEFTRLLCWIEHNEPLWRVLCGKEKEQMTMPGFRNILQKLHTEGFYPLILVFLTIYRDVPYVETSLNSLFYKALQEQCNHGQGKKMLQHMLCSLQ